MKTSALLLQRERSAPLGRDDGGAAAVIAGSKKSRGRSRGVQCPWGEKGRGERESATAASSSAPPARVLVTVAELLHALGEGHALLRGQYFGGIGYCLRH